MNNINISTDIIELDFNLLPVQQRGGKGINIINFLKKNKSKELITGERNVVK